MKNRTPSQPFGNIAFEKLTNELLDKVLVLAFKKQLKQFTRKEKIIFLQGYLAFGRVL